jgi:hypothetical protein
MDGMAAKHGVSFGTSVAMRRPMITRPSSSPLSLLSLALGSTSALLATSGLASSASAQEAQTSWAPRLYIDHDASDGHVVVMSCDDQPGRRAKSR